MLGRFHEISLCVRDIRAAVEFYERLGFTQAATTDALAHRYGVLVDGPLFLGLHERPGPSPVLTFVRPDVAGFAQELRERGLRLTHCRTGPDEFHEIGFTAPCGQTVAVLEARTYSPPSRNPLPTGALGYFSELALPARDPDAAAAFWSDLGFVAMDLDEDPWVRLPLTSDHLNISLHRSRILDRPTLVFRAGDAPERIARLRTLGLPVSPELPRGLDPDCNALFEDPDGNALLLLQEV